VPGLGSIAEPVLEVTDRGMSVRPDPTMIRDSRITLEPQLSLDLDVLHTPLSQEQSVGLEHDLPLAHQRPTPDPNPGR